MARPGHSSPPVSAFLPQTFGQQTVAAGLILCIVGLAAATSLQMRQRTRAAGQPGSAESAVVAGGSCHTRPIIERDRQRLLWARDDPAAQETEWFDVTDSSIDPEMFAHGIGKDAIPAIDEPLFAELDDPRVREAGITDGTIVIGFANGGEAKAYPLDLLDNHELVNDRVGGKPVTVGW